MGLNIKSKEAHELAAKLARLTGKSMTAVVTEALRTQLRQQHYQEKETRVQELMAIGKRCAAHIHQPVTAVQHGAPLFDGRGMPRFSSFKKRHFKAKNAKAEKAQTAIY